MTQKRQSHARESGHLDLAARAGGLDSRLRGNDTMLKDLILSAVPHYGGELSTDVRPGNRRQLSR